MGALLFTLPFLVGSVVEPIILAWSERLDRRRVVVAGLLLLALAQVAIASTSTAWTLAAAIAAWGIASGLTTSTAEVALVSGPGPSTERRMASWALFGMLGDLGGPLLYGGAARLGLDWRFVLIGGAAVAVADALLLGLGPPLRTEVNEEGEEEHSLREAIVDLARKPGVWLWLGAAALCSLFDETFVAFGSLWLRSQGASPEHQGWAFAAFAMGGAIALTLVERLGVGARRGLALGSVALSLVFPLWLLAPLGLALPLTALLGAAAAPLWPLSTARAYDHGRAGLVAALSRLFGPFEILAPTLLGLVADQIGLGAAMILLLAQPLGVGAIAAATRRR